MNRTILTAGAVAFAALSLGLSSTVLAETRKATILCVPPSGKPTPCGIAAAGSRVQLVVRGRTGSTPLVLRFDEVAKGKKPILSPARVTARPLSGRSDAYVLTMPTHWCAARAGEQIEFKIQMATSGMQQSASGGDRDSLGYFQMRC